MPAKKTVGIYKNISYGANKKLYEDIKQISWEQHQNVAEFTREAIRFFIKHINNKKK